MTPLQKAAEYTAGTWYSAAFHGGVIATSPKGEEAIPTWVQGGDCFVADAPRSDTATEAVLRR